jgi:flagellar basal-body rod protein FlgG
MGLQISASGILTALTRQRVTANNVANLNTSGFRAARANIVETASGGVAVGDITRDNATGGVQFTGRPTDFAVAEGFFQVEGEDGSTAFTRDGRFGLNADGEIVTADGARLSPAIQVPPNATSVSVTRTGTVFATTPENVTPQRVGQIQVFSFTNPDGLEAVGGNLFRATAASGVQTRAVENVAVEQGALNASNVNLATEQVNLLIDTRTAQANINAFRAQADVLGELINIVR